MLYQPYYQPIGLVEEGIGLVVKKIFALRANIIPTLCVGSETFAPP